MKKLLLLLICFSAGQMLLAQKAVTVIVKDSATNDAISGATVTQSKKSIVTNSAGRADFIIEDFKNPFIISAVGYGQRQLVADTSTTEIIVLLQQAQHTLEEVIVSSSRTESRIENLPTKVEVLGTEEVEEEGGIKPSHIASLLGDVAGIQSQQTSATTGNTEMRIQGLPGKYTQLLRDGMPLFGSFAGSFSVLQIPPLDLKQIEIIKGASSTLYGGGAIAGMINVISKRPKLTGSERILLLNYSSLNEANANVYFSGRNKKIGYTFFTGGTNQKEADVNKDGFSDVAKLKSFFIHPTIFFYPNKKNTISVGYNGNFEDRKGGDMLVLKNVKDAQHQFYIQNISARNTADVQWEGRINNSKHFTVKGIGSWFNRDIATNTFGMKATQLSYYTEAAYIIKSPKHDIVAGANFNGEDFEKRLPDSTSITNYSHHTRGLFVQDDWRIHPKFTLQSGLRTDFNSQYGKFILPRLSLLYKISPAFTSRLGGGMGYKIPTIFSSEIDERDYKILQPLQDVKAEKSYGGNFDVNYHQKIGETEVTINQSFYITQITDPIITTYTPSSISFANASDGLLTKGFETYVNVNINQLEMYLGYTYTNARKQYDAQQPYLELSARNKFASVIAYEFTDNFRAGVEAAVTGRQYLDDGTRTPAFPFMAAMMRYDINQISLVLNCENLLDYRQSKKEVLYTGPVNNPIFKQLWAPIDGRVINFSVRMKF